MKIYFGVNKLGFSKVLVIALLLVSLDLEHQNKNAQIKYSSSCFVFLSGKLPSVGRFYKQSRETAVSASVSFVLHSQDPLQFFVCANVKIKYNFCQNNLLSMALVRLRVFHSQHRCMYFSRTTTAVLMYLEKYISTTSCT